MILDFNTQFNGVPNFFIEKIWLGLIQYELSDYSTCNRFQKAHIQQFYQLWDFDKEANLIKRQFPKLHTIREDKKDRWSPGMKIDFVINHKKENQFVFAPELQVVSVQRILIVSEYHSGTRWEYVIIGGKMLPWADIDRLAINDGFSGAKEFFRYFCKYDDPTSKVEFCGKIIHWTPVKY